MYRMRPIVASLVSVSIGPRITGRVDRVIFRRMPVL